MTPDLVTLTRLGVELALDGESYSQTAFPPAQPGMRHTTQVVRWHRGEHLGSGTFGQVYIDKCMEVGRTEEKRAVKLIKKMDRIDYKRELEALAVLSYKSEYRDSFVNFIGWYETDIHVCIAMDFHELGSLDQYLAPTHAPLPESETKVITEQVLKALDYMHGLQTMHRDLKPANVLVVTTGPQWWVKLADFGFSKRAINSHAEAHTGGGTPLYMAPEMQGTFQDGTYTRSERVIYTEAVDIWAVGIMTFQILAGRPPFCPDEIEKYTTGKLRFPTRRLRRAMASGEACHFVQWLITSQPTLRANARECPENHWLRSHTTLPENPLSSSHSDSGRQSTVEELQEASATWASEEDEVSRIRVEEPTAIFDKKTAASDAAPLNFAASIAAPTAHLSRPVVVMVDATNRASDAVGTERGVTLGYPDVTVADYAIIAMEETHQQNGDTRSSSRNSNDYAYESDISSMPPDSSMEGSTAGSDIAREQEPKGSATTSDIESLFRNPGARRGRITQEVMGKTERSSANTRRSSRDSEESTLRRVYESHQMDDAKVSEVESGLFPFDRAVVDQDSRPRSHCSGVFRGPGKLNGSQLLQGVEHAIKRLLLSDVNALEEKKDLDRGRRTFEEKPSRTRRFFKWPKMVLFRDSNEPGTIVSLSDSEEKNQDEDGNKIESGESAGGHRRRDDNGASAGGLLTRAALEHLDSQSDAYHRAIEGADGCACNDCQLHRAQRDN